MRTVATVATRRVVERHQTLLQTVQWSYDLLSDEERTLFTRLGVFAGGVTLRSVEAVCGADPLDPADIIDLADGLVAKSLLVAEPEGGSALEPLNGPPGIDLRVTWRLGNKLARALGDAFFRLGQFGQIHEPFSGEAGLDQPVFADEPRHGRRDTILVGAE